MDDKKDLKKKKQEEQEPGAVKGTVQAYRAEFRKIVWPSKATLFKHTVTVIAVSLMFGAFIALNDFAFSRIFQVFVRNVL